MNEDYEDLSGSMLEESNSKQRDLIGVADYSNGAQNDDLIFPESVQVKKKCKTFLQSC